MSILTAASTHPSTAAPPPQRNRSTAASLRMLLGMLLLATTLPAADLVEAAWFARVDSHFGHWSSRIDSPNGRFQADDDTPTLGVAFGWRRSLARPGAAAGPVLGAEGWYAVASLPAGQATLIEGHAMGGWAWALSHRQTFGVLLSAGYGHGRVQLEEAESFGRYQGEGFGWSLTPSLDYQVLLHPRWAIGGRLFWRQAGYQLTGDSLDWDLRQSGPGLALIVEWRPAHRPRRIP